MLVRVIAPGNPIDGEWWDSSLHTIRFMDRPKFVAWSFSEVPDPICESISEVRIAYLRWYSHPSWSIWLPFYFDSRLNSIPYGYVFAGTVQGVPGASSPLCEVCRKHADTPTGRFCFTHLLEYMRSIGL